jgi:hypothetical protein
MVRLAGFEPTTYRLEGGYSIRLSYSRSYLHTGQNRNCYLGSKLDLCHSNFDPQLIKINVVIHNVPCCAIFIITSLFIYVYLLFVFNEALAHFLVRQSSTVEDHPAHLCRYHPPAIG